MGPTENYHGNMTLEEARTEATMMWKYYAPKFNTQVTIYKDGKEWKTKRNF